MKPEEKSDILKRLIAGENKADIAKRYHICVSTVYNIRDQHIDEIPRAKKKNSVDTKIIKMLQGWDRARLDFLRRHGG